MLFTRAGRRRTRPGRDPGRFQQTEPPPVSEQEPQAPDLGFLFALVALVSTGLVMMYSALAGEGKFGSLSKLGVGLFIGLILMTVSANTPLRKLRRVAPYLLAGSFLALLMLKIPGNPLALKLNGATRWLSLGPYTIQPSEYTKLAFVLFAAQFLDRSGQQMKEGLARPWAVFLGVTAVLCGLIYKEPDLGTTLVLAGTAFCMLLASGVNWKTLFGGALVAAVVVLVLAWNTDHQQARLLSWWNPWAEEHRMEGGYQVIRSWMAMARGGWLGVGLGQSTQKLENRLPESETDFIFAIVAEELGLLRAVGLIALFGLLAWRGFGIAVRAPDRYSSLVVSGVTSWVAVQSCLNIAVATGTVPNTGVPLPFISSGLSSLTALMAATGIVIGISRRLRPVPAERGPK